MAKRKRPAAKAPAAKTGTAGQSRSQSQSMGMPKASKKAGVSTADLAESTTAASASASAPPAMTGTRGTAKATSTRKAGVKPTPFDPEYERPISELPPLVFPNSEQYEFRLKAEERRRTRLRNEAIFGVGLGVIGVIVLVTAHTPGFLGLAAIAVVAMAAYELMVSGLE